MRPLRGLVITGTDTGVGKTWVTVRLLQRLQAQGWRVGAYKPACSGAEGSCSPTPYWEDVEALLTASTLPAGFSLDELRDWVCPQRFLAPLAPPLAAALEQREMDRELLLYGWHRWQGQVDAVLIEGAGGWFCPMTSTETFADLAVHWKLPVLIVARRTLGTINHTLLTIEAVRQRGLSVVGIILNEPCPITTDPSVPMNAAEIARRGRTHILAEFPYQPTTEQLQPPSRYATIEAQLQSLNVAEWLGHFPPSSLP
ncbi:MAG: hypothetical protein KatS3mg113_0663 [Planctomycetaceae bacterium]|nr:MAG: hypothetical protein KatS3mg113_0663 [Planctomycetaceae bacterium]